jgi:SAM-dependent methyltransferase
MPTPRSPSNNTSDRDLARFREVAAVIRHIVPDLSARIVDIGCANGQLLQALAEHGYSSLVGIDPSPSCVQEAKRIPGVRAFVGSLSEMPTALRPYDVVVLSHVLEHVRDVHPALENLKSEMRRGSLLYVEVPDAARYADYAWSPFQDFNTEHINHFSAVSLANLLRRAGLRVDTVASKDLLTAPGMPYPAIYSLSTLAENPTSDHLEPDVDLRKSLARYVKNSQELLDAIDERLSKVVGSGEPVLIWGTGELTSKLLATTSLRHANIRGFVDANPANQGCRLWGHRIVAPSELTPGTETIVVASILHYEAIRQDIRARGLRNPVLGLRPDANASIGPNQ